MVKTLYKQQIENFTTVYHKDSNSLERFLEKTTASRLDGYRVEKVYHFAIDKVDTTKEVFLEEYGNPLCEVSNERRTLVVETEENKVRIGIYLHHKFRKVGKKFFAKEFNRYFLTYNTKTNNFYITVGGKGLGHRAYRSVKTNSFVHLNRFVDYFQGFEVNETTHNFLTTFINQIDKDNKVSVNKNNLYSVLTSVFVKLNGIKGPDHTNHLVCTYYTGKKSLKKNGHNVVHSILDTMGLKTKYFIGLFNQYQPELEYISLYYRLLGPKYMRTVSKEFLGNESTPYASFNYKVKNVTNQNIPESFNITDEERKNIVKLVNSFYRNGNTVGSYRRNLTSLIEDHLSIIHKIKKFEPDIKFRAKNYDEFNNEHINYSEKYSLYRKSEEVYYQYDKELVESLKYGYKGCEYVLLTNDMEYINESSYQSNCVRTYIDKFKSIIISVRKGKERVTTEFNYKGQCIQKRGRFNEPVSEPMREYVEHLETIISELYGENKLKPARIKIFNKVTKKESHYEMEELTKSGYKINEGNDFMDFLDEEMDFMYLG